MPRPIVLIVLYSNNTASGKKISLSMAKYIWYVLIYPDIHYWRDTRVLGRSKSLCHPSGSQ